MINYKRRNACKEAFRLVRTPTGASRRGRCHHRPHSKKKAVFNVVFIKGLITYIRAFALLISNTKLLYQF